jgi:hypothetical protein
MLEPDFLITNRTSSISTSSMGLLFSHISTLNANPSKVIIGFELRMLESNQETLESIQQILRRKPI